MYDKNHNTGNIIASNYLFDSSVTLTVLLSDGASVQFSLGIFLKPVNYLPSGMSQISYLLLSPLKDSDVGHWEPSIKLPRDY